MEEAPCSYIDRNVHQKGEEGREYYSENKFLRPGRLKAPG